MRNAADPQQVKDAGVRDKRVRERQLGDFRAVMELSAGRRFIARLLDTCGFQKLSFTGNAETYFNEGRRAIALEVWADINAAAPDLYFTMINEAKENTDV